MATKTQRYITYTRSAGWVEPNDPRTFTLMTPNHVTYGVHFLGKNGPGTLMHFVDKNGHEFALAFSVEEGGAFDLIPEA